LGIYQREGSTAQLPIVAPAQGHEQNQQKCKYT